MEGFEVIKSPLLANLEAAVKKASEGINPNDLHILNAKLFKPSIEFDLNKTRKFD